MSDNSLPVPAEGDALPGSGAAANAARNRGSAAANVVRYRRLLGRAGAVCFELAPDGTALYLGGPLLALTGYRPDELLGRNLWQTLCPGPQAAAAADLCARLGA